jgi:hypothetical protein
MFIKQSKKANSKHAGLDSSSWRVVTYSGEELGRYESHKDAATGKVVRGYVTRWNGFRTANQAAAVLGGVAVRA